MKSLKKSFTFLVRLNALDKNKKLKCSTCIELGHFEDETALDFEVKISEHLSYYLFHEHCEFGYYEICGVVRKGKRWYFYEG